MLFSLNLLEIFPIFLINIFFFFIFLSILVLSYPLGKYFLYNYCENDLLKHSLFSLVVFSTLVSIATNLAPVFGKYLIVTFYLINSLILIFNKRIRSNFYQTILLSKKIFLFIFIIFLLLSIIFKSIFAEDGKLIILFDDHITYFINPISEILTSDYFSRLKILSLYPLEWGTFHFFPASFNSFYLFPIYDSGSIGVIVLKLFFLSIFLYVFFASFINKKENKNIILNFLFVFIVFILAFSPKVIYLVLTNNFIPAISSIFIIQSIINKKKNEFLVWTIILSISSFKNIFISLILIIYYLKEEKLLNFSDFLKKIKKILNLPNIILSILFIFYILSTFYNSESVNEKFHLLTGKYYWWLTTTTNTLIENYIYFILTIFFFTLVYLFLFKKKEKFFPDLAKNDLIYLSLFLVLPFICLSLLLFKQEIVNYFEIIKLEIFFESFTVANLKYYFFVPLIWGIALLSFNKAIKYTFMIAILLYTFLSIFIYNSITVPGIYIIELMILFFIFRLLQDKKNFNKLGVFSYLFIISIVISCLYKPSIYYNSIVDYNGKHGSKLVFAIDDLKKLKNKEYLCPQDIKSINQNKFAASALSGILVKPYYSEISIDDKYDNWHNTSLRWAVVPKKNYDNPCTN